MALSLRPSRYQLIMGGGMALLSQDRLMGCPRTTSVFSVMSLSSWPPSSSSSLRPQAASLLTTRWNTGGTGAGERSASVFEACTIYLFYLV